MNATLDTRPGGGPRRHTRSAILALLVGLGIAATACIETQRQHPDTTPDLDTFPDTVTSDLPDTVTSDLPDTAPDAVDTDDANDTSDTSVDCVEDADCPKEECVVYICRNQRCEPTNLSDTPCNDGNVCTEGDSCKSGVCHAGAEIDCNAIDEQCWESTKNTCDPVTGCGTAEPLGAACNNGQGTAPSICVDGWRIPADSCDGRGTCVDGANQIPLGLNPMAGDWIVVLANAPHQRMATTIRMSLSFNSQGGFSLVRIVFSSNAVFPDLHGGANGTYCTSLDGRVTLTIGNTQLEGWIRKGDDLLVLRDADPTGVERFHGIAIRASGSPAEVTGTYQLVSTATYSMLNPAPIMTWQGHLGFDNGCISDAGSISTGGNLGTAHSYPSTPPACFFAHEGGHRIMATLMPDSGTAAQGVAVRWTGAIGARGNVLVLTRDDNNLHYGIIVLVRDRVTDNAQLSGPYAFVSIGGGISSSTQTITAISPYLETGTIEYLAANAVGGSMTSGTVGPGWWHIPPLGSRYAHRAAFNGTVREHGGWVARNDSFLMAWRVAPPANGTLPQPLSLTPTEGSLFLAIQPADYRPALSGTP